MPPLCQPALLTLWPWTEGAPLGRQPWGRRGQRERAWVGQGHPLTQSVPRSPQDPCEAAFIQPSMSHSLRPALQRERVLWGADLLRELVLRGALEAEGQQRSGCRTGPKGFMRSGSPELQRSERAWAQVSAPS